METSNQKTRVTLQRHGIRQDRKMICGLSVSTPDLGGTQL